MFTEVAIPRILEYPDHIEKRDNLGRLEVSAITNPVQSQMAMQYLNT